MNSTHPSQREIEKYFKDHDIKHLFERLTASILYDRPEDVNSYARDWLVRLSSSEHKIPSAPDLRTVFSLNTAVTSDAASSDPDEKHDVSGQSKASNQFDPYLISPDNVQILYGMLDPLNEGIVPTEQLREVSKIIGIDKHIDWRHLGSEMDRETFCEQMLNAIERDLDHLRYAATGRLDLLANPFDEPEAIDIIENTRSFSSYGDI